MKEEPAVKKLLLYLLLGVLVALGGMMFSAFTGNFFSGMDFGSASVLGICMYLCVVVVACTGVIVAKLEESRRPGNADEE